MQAALLSSALVSLLQKLQGDLDHAIVFVVCKHVSSEILRRENHVISDIVTNRAQLLGRRVPALQGVIDVVIIDGVPGQVGSRKNL